MSVIYDRQNDAKALRYLQAARYTEARENTIKYFQIFLSLALCLVGIFFRYSEHIGLSYTQTQRDAISIWLSLISGIVIILQMFFAIYTSRMHIESVNLMELYDSYVLGLPQNKLIMRPISEITIDSYANKYRKKSEKFKNYYFENDKALELKNCTFENQKLQFFNSYKLLIKVKPFFQFVWISFFVAIVAICANFDDKFINTLVNILIPSLSIITLIVGSWHNLNEDMRSLQNNLNNLNKLKEEASKSSSNVNLNSTIILRATQDSLFSFRMKSFTVPNTLAKIYTRTEKLRKPEKPKAVPEKSKTVSEKSKSVAAKTKPTVSKPKTAVRKTSVQTKTNKTPTKKQR